MTLRSLFLAVVALWGLAVLLWLGGYVLDAEALIALALLLAAGMALLGRRSSTRR